MQGNKSQECKKWRLCKTFGMALEGLLEEEAASRPLAKVELFEKIGMAVLVGHVDGSPMMYGMDRIAAVLDTVPSFGSMGKDIIAIYGRNLTLGGSEYGISWVAYDYATFGK